MSDPSRNSRTATFPTADAATQVVAPHGMPRESRAYWMRGTVSQSHPCGPLWRRSLFPEKDVPVAAHAGCDEVVRGGEEGEDVLPRLGREDRKIQRKIREGE